MKIATLLVSSLIVGLLTTAATPQDERSRAEAAFAAARAVSPTPLRLDQDRRSWLQERAFEGAVVAEVDDLQAEHWIASAARDARTRALAVRTTSLPDACVDIGLSNCSTATGGYLNIDGRRLSWQLQNGVTPEDGTAAGYVLLTGDDRLRAEVWGHAGIRYEPPTVMRVEGQTYVAIPGRIAGTGAYNADALFRVTPGADPLLTEIDNETWRDADLPALLPTGLEIWKGVAFNYDDESLTARTSLWTSRDGNCCPSGGQATLVFEIRGGRLVLTELLKDATP
ncbi:hypothetical protein [Brevundimonas sp.]|uniref:hypothetical protein n=1 Tax=Brevundimonas sp. TaxID=1871086 RepID=UPI003F71842F